MKMKPDVSRFVRDYVKELREQNAAIFAGAGLSAAAGFVNWAELLRPLAKDLGLKIELETDLVAVAQFVVNEAGGNRSKINQRLIEEVDVVASPTRNHRLLAELPISTYWTTNYDTLIETALRDRGKTVDVKYRLPHLSTTKPKRDAVVYKMHGDAQHPDQTVLTRDDYERYPLAMPGFITALSGDLFSKTFLFLGFSFTDPNLDDILARVRTTFRENQREHFAFFRKRTKLPHETDEEFQHAVVRQQLGIKDLQRFNVKVLLVDEFEEITEALEEVVRRTRARSVFVSGSAADYAPWGQPAAEEFLRRLGSEFAKANFRTASGFGFGVATALLTGVIQRVQCDAKLNLDDAMLVRPFPLAIADDAERAAAWDAYRRAVIEEAGIAVFLFGNKLDGGVLGDAGGVNEEFEIARQMGRVLLPVGATGSAAKNLWERVMREFDSFYPNATAGFREAVLGLGRDTADLNDLVAPVMTAISLAEKGAANGA